MPPAFSCENVMFEAMRDLIERNTKLKTQLDAAMESLQELRSERTELVCQVAQLIQERDAWEARALRAEAKKCPHQLAKEFLDG